MKWYSHCQHVCWLHYCRRIRRERTAREYRVSVPTWVVHALRRINEGGKIAMPQNYLDYEVYRDLNEYADIENELYFAEL